jgi:lipopolysaccharide transport system permease protein
MNKSVSTLSSEPLIIITPKQDSFRTFITKNLAHTQVLKLLSMKDIKLRFQETKAGNVWFLVQPLVTLIIFTVFLGYVARVPTGDLPYVLFFLSGLIPVTFFNTVMQRMASSIYENSYIVSKVYFPRTIIPLSVIAGVAIDFMVMSILLVLLTFYNGYTPALSTLWLIPLATICLTLIAAGVGLCMSIVTLKYKDMRVMLPMITQVVMFASPVIYPIQLVPEKFHDLYISNPLAPIIDIWRQCFFQSGELSAHAFISPLIAAIVLPCLGIYYFYKNEKHIMQYL